MEFCFHVIRRVAFGEQELFHPSSPGFGIQTAGIRLSKKSGNLDNVLRKQFLRDAQYQLDAEELCCG